MSKKTCTDCEPWPTVHQSTIDELRELAEERAGWHRIEVPACDICFRPAKWQHPSGGLRCGTCPRPT